MEGPGRLLAKLWNFGGTALLCNVKFCKSLQSISQAHKSVPDELARFNRTLFRQIGTTAVQ